MLDGEGRWPWRRIVVAGGFAALAWSAAFAKDSPTSIKEAEQYLAQGNLKAAEIELRNAIREAPQDPVLRARLAEVYLQLGDARSAESEARAARERNGKEADYLPVLADALLSQQKFSNLIDSVQPGNRDPVLESKLRTALGTAAAGLGDRAKAETLLDEAIKLDPGAARPKIQLARLLTGTKPAEADKLIDGAIAADPRSAEALQVKGEILRSRGDQEGAMRLFGEALKIDPKNVSALLSRASINIALGKYQAADEDIDPILKASPNHFMANYLRGVELARRKKYAEADRILDRISTGFAAFWPGYFVQGATKLELGQYAQAETTFGKYLAHVPDDIKAAQLIAYALAPNSVPILSRYLTALKSAKYFTEARGVLQEAIRRDPRNSSLKADLIRFEADINGVDAAVARARALAASDPEDNIYGLVSAELYEKAGRKPDAIAVLEKAAAAKPFRAALRARLSVSIASVHFCWAMYVSVRPRRVLTSLGFLVSSSL